jgi:hypothetical protein
MEFLPHALAQAEPTTGVRHTGTLGVVTVRCYGSHVVFEWELDKFKRIRLEDDIEILMDSRARFALVLVPWHRTDEPEVDKAMWHAQAQGFEVIVEMGNIVGYTIPEVDNEDWEFILMEPQSE